MSYYQGANEIELLVAGFTSKTLPKEKWTHEAHLTTAIWHLKMFDLDEATCLLRSGIIAYNLAVGGVNNGSSGYHETLTIFWVTIVDYFVRKHPAYSITEACNSFLGSNLADKTLPFQFYIKEHILSPAARARFLPADKLALTEDNIGLFCCPL